MTTPDVFIKPPPVPGRFRLPDIPEREPDEVTQFDQLFKTGRSYFLAIHLGNPETTLVEADRWIIAEPGSFRDLARYPDLMIAFDVDPELYEASNGYIVSEQGKGPDFVLEVASPSTASEDTGPKRDDYAALGALEYWLFDKTGEHHGARLAGYRLVDGEYVSIDIEELPDGGLQGYSTALNLNLRWEGGELVFCDPATNRSILTYEDQQARADAEQARADAAEAQRSVEQARADAAEAELAAERARVRELEERLRRQNL